MADGYFAITHVHRDKFATWKRAADPTGKCRLKISNCYVRVGENGMDRIKPPLS